MSNILWKCGVFSTVLFSYFVIKLEMSNLVKFPNLSRKIVAVGRNYAEHAAELGNAVPSKPLLFMKVRQEKPLSKGDEHLARPDLFPASFLLYNGGREDRNSSWLSGASPRD